MTKLSDGTWKQVSQPMNQRAGEEKRIGVFYVPKTLAAHGIAQACIPYLDYDMSKQSVEDLMKKSPVWATRCNESYHNIAAALLRERIFVRSFITKHASSTIFYHQPGKLPVLVMTLSAIEQKTSALTRCVTVNPLTNRPQIAGADLDLATITTNHGGAIYRVCAPVTEAKEEWVKTSSFVEKRSFIDGMAIGDALLTPAEDVALRKKGILLFPVAGLVGMDFTKSMCSIRIKKDVSLTSAMDLARNLQVKGDGFVQMRAGSMLVYFKNREITTDFMNKLKEKFTEIEAIYPEVRPTAWENPKTTAEAPPTVAVLRAISYTFPVVFEKVAAFLGAKIVEDATNDFFCRRICFPSRALLEEKLTTYGNGSIASLVLTTLKDQSV
jgi:hypothetical protein